MDADPITGIGVGWTSFERFEPSSPYGSAREIADFLAPFVAAGCKRFNVMAVAECTEAVIDAVGEVRERLREAS